MVLKTNYRPFLNKHGFVKLTNHTSVGCPVRSIKYSIWLAGSDEKRSGKPVVVKDFPLGADKGEVEPYVGSRLKIWRGGNFILQACPLLSYSGLQSQCSGRRGRLL